MGRMWSIPWTATVTAAGTDTDLWELTPADDVPVLIRMIRLGQITEVKDAEEEGLRISVKRLLATVTSGSGGSAGAPEDLLKANQSPSFSSETNNATVATTSGTTEVLDEIGWINRQTPLEIWYPDERFTPRAQQGEVLVVRMETTLNDDMTFVGSVIVEEL